MYLPYLALASRSAGSAPAPRIPPAGYRTVPTLAFEPDELSALVRAVRQVKAAGDPALARDADSAMQKLSYDLGLALGAVAGESEDARARAPESGRRLGGHGVGRSPPSAQARDVRLPLDGPRRHRGAIGRAVRTRLLERTLVPRGPRHRRRRAAQVSRQPHGASRCEHEEAAVRRTTRSRTTSISPNTLRRRGRGSSATTRRRTWSSRSAATPAPPRPSNRSAPRSPAIRRSGAFMCGAWTRSRDG